MAPHLPHSALLGGALAAAAVSVALAAPAGRAESSLAADAAAVLARRCLSCHGPDRKTAGIDLSTRAGAAAAGAARPDDPAQNRLVRAVAAGKMPPNGRLPDAEVALLRRWVRAGLPYPTAALTAVPLPDQPLWSLQPVRRPRVPAPRFGRLARNAVDRFVFARLAAAGLRPSPPAGRLALLRRVTVDLTGLPPTPEEVDLFLEDRSPDAYEKVVARLLASPAYGERWGRHWLDVVRFGESHGYEQNHLRPNAWPYRDYVIAALNEDRPYDRFIREQLAGDVVGRGDPLTEAATGFLVAGVHDTVGNQTVEGTRQKRSNDLDDMVATTGEAFLGLTVGCARCHDHKFDPVPQRDYYRLAAVFAGVQHGERPLALAPGASAVGATRRQEEFAPAAARFVRFTVTVTADGAEPCLDELEVYGPGGDANLALEPGAVASASSLLPGYPIHQVRHLNDGRLGNNFSWISAERGRGWAQIELARPAAVNRVVWSRDGSPRPRYMDRVPVAYRVEVSTDGARWSTVVERGGGSAGGLRPGTPAYAGRFTEPEPVHLLARGDVMQRGEEVRPGALSRIPGFPGELAPDGRPLADAERRLALAEWIASPKNPLTARVMVNRIWQHHFGRGLVETPSDFGHNGRQPSHPELLDWLASDFMAGGWKLKRLHRMLVTSHVYRQASAPVPEGIRRDAENRLLWHMPLRRMEGEALRDAVLAAGGRLDRRMGGPGFQLFRYRTVNVAIYEPVEEYGPETWRRSVYRQAARAIREELLGAFDCPESAQRSPRRSSTTTALQALSLLNGPFMHQQSGLFAARVREQAGEDPLRQVTLAFRIAFGRPPSAAEAEAARGLAAAHGLEAVCRGLMNASEFLYY